MVDRFSDALEFVLKHEGGYSNDPRDKGGATNYGISIRWLISIGDFDQDGFLDGDFDHDGDVDWEDIAGMSREDAAHLYRTHWWDRFRYERLVDQSIARKTFDLAVNMGPGRAHKILQRAINRFMPKEGKIAEDGQLGPLTFQAANGFLLIPQLYKGICEEAAKYYVSLNRPEFISGWLKRAYA